MEMVGMANCWWFNICPHSRICIKLDRLQYVAMEMVDEIFDKHMDGDCRRRCAIGS
jgi:hypothetical protein